MAQQMSVGGVVLRTGTRLTLADEDYKFGRGPITVVVRTVLQVVVAADGEWVELDTDQVYEGATDTQRRLVQVRATALAAAVRPRRPT